MKRINPAILILLLFVFTISSCTNTSVSSDEPTLQTINLMIEQRWKTYLDRCEGAGLDGLCKDVFDSTEKSIKYAYRSVQYVMFDVIHEDGFADGGIHNYDVYLYEDGTADMVYRHGIEDDKLYIIDENISFEMTAEEISLFENVIAECDFESIPTWDPEEPSGLDGETTYILGTDGWSSHLATLWNADEGDGIYKIRTTMEQIANAHE